ncbi:MAG: HesA/MoeB/ThiF family protein [Dissulfuribacterales bacterium]
MSNNLNFNIKSDIQDFLNRKSKEISDPVGRKVRIISNENALEISGALGCSIRKVYIEALKLGICPHIYLRNRDILSIDEQLKLSESTVAVIGSGGLGGYVIMLLARIGIGRLVVVDYDTFDETNLNRQVLSKVASVGLSKPDEARLTVNSVNPAVEIIPRKEKLDKNNAYEMIKDVDVVVDALDNIEDRLVLARAVKKSGIPLVHGAVAGFDGHVMTIFPEDMDLEKLYGSENPGEEASERMEKILGVPSITPCIIGGLEAMEVVKILLKRGKPLRNKMAYIDLENFRFDLFKF